MSVLELPYYLVKQLRTIGVCIAASLDVLEQVSRQRCLVGLKPAALLLHWFGPGEGRQQFVRIP